MNSKNFKMDADFVREALGLGSTRGNFGMYDSLEIVQVAHESTQRTIVARNEALAKLSDEPYSGHLIDELIAAADNAIALSQLARVRKLCSSLFADQSPCTHQAVTFCGSCGREICLNCAEKFLMETYCEQCAEQERANFR